MSEIPEQFITHGSLDAFDNRAFDIGFLRVSGTFEMTH
jgi:hypothetical protein